MPKTNNIRVIQLIDSLDAGGGERMAVNLANALVDKVQFSGLVCTRKEGVLKSLLSKKTSYFFSNKKRSLDFLAVKKTLAYLKQNDIQFIHAHGSSFFFAFLLKIFQPSLKIVWHDHHGNRVNESQQLNNKLLKQLSRGFKHVFCVSNELVEWSKKNLKISSVSHINNFVSIEQDALLNNDNNSEPYIVCVANLRQPKNHFNLIRSFHLLKSNKQFEQWKLNLVGDDKKDNYSTELKSLISKLNLKNEVFILGQRSDVSQLIKNAKIAILSSDIEALPMALIEYAIAKKPVVVTNVGQCAEVVGDYGKVVPPNNPKALAEAIQFYIENPTEAKNDALALHDKVSKEFNPETIIQQVIGVYEAAH